MKRRNPIIAILVLGVINANAQYSSSWKDPLLQKQIATNIEKYRKGDAFDADYLIL